MEEAAWHLYSFYYTTLEGWHCWKEWQTVQFSVDACEEEHKAAQESWVTHLGSNQLQLSMFRTVQVVL